MQRIRLMTALTLALAAELVSGEMPIAASDLVAGLKPSDNRAMDDAIAVTVHLTPAGTLIRLPASKHMNSMAECRAWTRQQEFMRVLPGYLATFHYCDHATEQDVPG